MVKRLDIQLAEFFQRLLTGAVLCFLIAQIMAVNASVTMRIEPIDIYPIDPDNPPIASCLAFGAGPGAGIEDFDDGAPGFISTSPFMGFIYRNIPPFELSPGDILAFDLGKENDFDVELDIAMAAATENGSSFEAEPFTKIITNTKTPVNPRGDEEFGNFEMQFMVESPYSFPGGGLIMRFSNGSDAYRKDLTCTQVSVVANTTDSSGFFANAFARDRDGVAPFEPFENQPERLEIIAGFEITEPDKLDVLMLSNDFVDDQDAQLVGTFPGDTIHYRARIMNPQNSAASGIEVVLTPDPNLVFGAATADIGSISAPDVDGKITWTAGTLAVDESAEIDIEIDLPLTTLSTTYENSALISAIDALFVGNNEVTAKTPLARIQIKNEVVNDSGESLTAVFPGDMVHDRIILNNVLGTAASGIEVIATLADNAEYIDASTDPLGMTVDYQELTGEVIWSADPLAAGESAEIDITLKVQESTSSPTFENSARINLIDAPFIAGNESAWIAEIARKATLENVALDFANTEITSVVAGTDFKYRVTVSNDDLADASGMEIIMDVSDAFEIIDTTTTPTANVSPDPDDPTRLIWAVDTLNINTDAVLELVMHVPISTEPDSIIQSVAEMSEVDRPFAKSPSVSWGISITENPSPDTVMLENIAVDLDDQVITSAVAGKSFKYLITVTNEEEITATGLEIMLAMPEELTFEGAFATPAAPAVKDPDDPTILIWTVDTLERDSSTVLEVTMRVPTFLEVGTVINSSAEISSADDPFLPGQTSELEILIKGLAQDLLDNAGSSKCFIATAAYGSFLEPEVIILRKFRDRYLLTNMFGRAFVDWYYRNSPPVAEFIAQYPAAKQLTRLAISPLVYAIKYPLISLFLCLMSILLIVTRFDKERYSVPVGANS